MTEDILIDVCQVRKKYSQSLRRSMKYGIHDIYCDLIGRDTVAGLRPEEFYATYDVSLQVKRGECLGLIGSNGAGKSTLLKMINGIFMPDEGSITVKGKVGALIEVGAGFHPMLSGRENIYISASILGMQKDEIDEKLESIIEFSELEEFIDMPVKNYSSGMYVRLGFAIVAHLEPDILIIDEVLAVGDMSFRSKCYREIDRLRKKCAIIFVSHSMQQISRVCDRVCYLERGELVFSGDTASAINQFNQGTAQKISSNREEAGTGEVRIHDFSISRDGTAVTTVSHGDELEVLSTLNASRPISDVVVNLAFYSTDETLVMQCTNQGVNGVDLPEGKTTHKTVIPYLPLVSGIYNITVLVQSSDLLVPYAWTKQLGSIIVESNLTSNAPVRLPVEWHQQ
jgi:lipopolysaccharide transport system ATP-binding protein